MKRIVILSVLFLIAKTVFASYAPMNVIGKVRIADKSGLISTNGIEFADTFSVASATPTISLSSYVSAQGGTSFKLKAITGYRASATATNAPQATVSGLTSTSVSCVLTQQNTATVTILGINVLSGNPYILVPDPQNVKVVLSGTIY